MGQTGIGHLPAKGQVERLKRDHSSQANQPREILVANVVGNPQAIYFVRSQQDFRWGVVNLDPLGLWLISPASIPRSGHGEVDV